MEIFASIYAKAVERAGRQSTLEEQLPQPKSADELCATPDDRYLSLMCLRIFRAGLKHSLVDARWPAFEKTFHGFSPRPIVAMSDEELERLMGDKRLVRHWAKMKAVRANASAMLKLAEEKGSFGRYLADWPGTEIVELWADLGRRFAQLGGNSAPSVLRMVGKDTFLLTGDVVQALLAAGASEREPKSKADRKAVQAAFNRWVEESGRPLCHISRILALSVG